MRAPPAARTGPVDVHLADLIVTASTAVMVAGLFWIIAGFMRHHRGHVWLGMIAICFALWVFLVTVAVSALFHVS